MRFPARHLITMIVVESLACLGIIGAIIAHAFHAPVTGTIGLVAALTANGVLVAWARKLNRGVFNEAQQALIEPSTQEEP